MVVQSLITIRLFFLLHLGAEFLTFIVALLYLQQKMASKTSQTNKPRKSLAELRRIDSQFERASHKLLRQTTAVRSSQRVNQALKNSALAIARLDAEAEKKELKIKLKEASEAIERLESATEKEIKSTNVKKRRRNQSTDSGSLSPSLDGMKVGCFCT